MKMIKIKFLYHLFLNIIKARRKKKIYRAFIKSKRQILSGIKNYIIRNDDIEAIANYRFKICKECPMITYDSNGCVVPDTQPCCLECGCCLELKVRSLSSSCPLNKWDKILTSEQELEYLIKINQK